MVDDYLLIMQWLFMAIGAALLLGTGSALLHYRRNGVFPGQPATDSRGRPSVASPRTAVVKVVIGAVLVVWGALGLFTRYVG
jgi:hypothetical protein